MPLFSLSGPYVDLGLTWFNRMCWVELVQKIEYFWRISKFKIRRAQSAAREPHATVRACVVGTQVSCWVGTRSQRWYLILQVYKFYPITISITNILVWHRANIKVLSLNKDVVTRSNPLLDPPRWMFHRRLYFSGLPKVNKFEPLFKTVIKYHSFFPPTVRGGQ